MDMNAVITGVAGVVAGLGGAIAYAKRIEAKVLPLLHGAKEFIDHVKQNQEAKQTIEEVKQAFEAESTAERDALIKSAAYCALQEIGVEISILNDFQKVAIGRYVVESLPDKFQQDVTPATIAQTLTVIQAELNAARNHSGMQAVLAAAIGLLQVRRVSRLKNFYKHNKPRRSSGVVFIFL